MKAKNSFIDRLINKSPQKTALYNRAAELKRQADTNRHYASACARTFAETGRESCLRSEALHLAAAERKEREADTLLALAVSM